MKRRTNAMERRPRQPTHTKAGSICVREGAKTARLKVVDADTIVAQVRLATVRAGRGGRDQFALVARGEYDAVAALSK